MTGEPGKSHIQHVAEQYAEPIARFIEAAETYCSVIEAWEADPASFANREAFIVAIQRALPLVYARALDLPELVELIEDDDEDEDQQTEAPAGEETTGLSGDSLDEQIEARNRDRIDRFPTLAGYAFGQYELQHRLERYLRWDTAYLSVYRPYEHRSWEEDANTPLDESRFPRAAYDAIPGEMWARAAGPANLADDLASVYDWLKESSLVWTSGEDFAMFDALWNWRFQLEVHGGPHLLSGLKAIHWLGYYVADPEDRYH